MKILKEELILSFTTASSEAVLPNIMRKWKSSVVQRQLPLS